MGVRGKKYLRINHKKSLSPPSQPKDAGWGNPPHPLHLTRGMRFWPRTGKRKQPFEIRGIAGDVANGLRLGPEGGTLRLTTARLLAVRDDGQGRHYQFSGYKPGRYTTYAYVHSIDQRHALLVLPNWHNRRPVSFPAELVPRDSRVPGSWLRCQADLGAATAARLNIARPRPCAPPPATRCHPPAYAPDTDRPEKPRPESGPGCGDIVLERAGDVADLQRRGGLLDVFAPKRPPDLRRGDRVFLALDGGQAVTGYLIIERIEQRPMGAVLRCQSGAVRLLEPIPIPGERQQNVWRWRWWPVTAEDDSPEAAAA